MRMEPKSLNALPVMYQSHAPILSRAAFARFHLLKMSVNGARIKKHCHPKTYKSECKVKVSKTMRERALMKANTATDKFKNYAKLRNGAETVPSLLKNVYGVNKMRVHGKLRCKFFFGSKIAALNFKKLFRFRKGSGHYAPYPVLVG